MGKSTKKESIKEYELVYANKLPAKELIASIKPAKLKKIKIFGKPAHTLPGSTRPNTLIRADNSAALKALIAIKDKGRLANPDGSTGVRLVYIDPPFSTRLQFKDKKNRKAYKDDIVGAEFIEFMRTRLVLLKELLSDNGSIFVHLDWKKAHYIKAVMDEVFGVQNFLNDIIWSYGGRGAKATSGQFSRNHDIILWYGPGGHVFNRVYTESKILKGTGGFRQDKEARWFKTSPRGDYTDSSITALEAEGRIHRTRTGKVRIKYFVKEAGDHLIERKPVGDVWDDIPDAMHLPLVEKTGYPTQKPELLLKRIIESATNPGDIVLDAFAGAGTTLAAAEKLGRGWIGIDSSELSIRTIKKRLKGLAHTKDLEDPGGRYSRDCSAYTFYRAE